MFRTDSLSQQRQQNCYYVQVIALYDHLLQFHNKVRLSTTKNYFSEHQHESKTSEALNTCTFSLSLLSFFETAMHTIYNCVYYQSQLGVLLLLFVLHECIV